MITPQVHLCALPAATWESETEWGGHSIAIGSLVADAMGIERRIQKGVNVEAERNRYNLCCARIESSIPSSLLTHCETDDDFLGALARERIPARTLAAIYLDILRVLLDDTPATTASDRIGATVFPPEQVEVQYEAFLRAVRTAGILDEKTVQQRLAFFRMAANSRCGVVEIRDFFAVGDEEPPTRPMMDVVELDVWETEHEDEESLSEKQRRNLHVILRDQVSRAIETGHDSSATRGSVNFSNQPHNVITEVLNEFVFVESSCILEPVHIKVVYTDGSQGASFPLLCLPRRQGTRLSDQEGFTELHVALMSMRHPEMDADVDLAWFRNREVSKSRSLGESDNFCYEQSKNQLRETRTGGDLRIVLYHTGFQPAVIGFYRALVEELLERPEAAPRVEVIPYYYRRNAGYEPGHPWG